MKVIYETYGISPNTHNRNPRKRGPELWSCVLHSGNWSNFPSNSGAVKANSAVELHG